MNIKKIFLSLMVITLIQGCANSDNEIKTYNEPRFVDNAPLELKVSRIETVSEFTPSFRRPNVEHLFPISIEKTAKLWTKDRLEASEYSSDKEAIVTIKDASVTEEVVKSDKMFYKDSLKYKATLHVVIKIKDKKNFSSAETEIQAWRELVIPADTDIAEKEKYWNGMVNKLFDEFNTKMENNIRQYLGTYLNNGGKITPSYY